MVSRIPAFFFLLFFALSGCMQGVEGLSLGSSQSTAEREAIQATQSLARQTRDIITRNALQGAAAGAGIAGLGTLLAGGSGGDAARNAAIGAVIGGAGGAAVGSAAAEKNTQIRNREATLADLQQTNQEITAARASVQRAISEQNREIAGLRRQLQAGEISQSAYTSRVNSINRTRGQIRSNLSQASDNLASDRQGVSDSAIVSRSRNMESRLDQLERSVTNASV